MDPYPICFGGPHYELFIWFLNFCFINGCIPVVGIMSKFSFSRTDIKSRDVVMKQAAEKPKPKTSAWVANS